MAFFSAGFCQVLLLTGTVLLPGTVLFSHPALAANGQALYDAMCSSCHKSSGAGVIGKFPPLKDRAGNMAATPEGRTYLAHVVINGLTGTITSGKETYTGYMPSFRALSNNQLSEILTYIASFGSRKKTAPFTPEEVKATRKAAIKAPDILTERNNLTALNPAPE